MKRQRIYLDTSVIGGCFDPEFAPWSKGLMRYQTHAAHIALATVAQVDLLVSWNFRHIVRFDKIRRFNAANRELGYKEIEIYSPREVTRYEEP